MPEEEIQVTYNSITEVRPIEVHHPENMIINEDGSVTPPVKVTPETWTPSDQDRMVIKTDE
jgi:hypothetical protein